MNVLKKIAIAASLLFCVELILGFTGTMVMVGGVADNYGIVRAIEEHLGHKIIVPKNAQLTGALGAALYAMDIAKKK